MVFDTSPPASSTSTSSTVTDRILSFDRMFPPHEASGIELTLSDERDLSQIDSSQRPQAPKWKMISKRRQSCNTDMYASAASRYHRLKTPTTINPLSISDETSPPTMASNFEKFHQKYGNEDMKCFQTQNSASVSTRRSTTDCNDLLSFHQRSNSIEQPNTSLLSIVDEEARDPIWQSSDDHLLVPSCRAPTVNEKALSRFYSEPSMIPCSPPSSSSSSSVSSFNLHSNSSDLSISSPYSSSMSFFNGIPESNHGLSSSSGYESNIPTSTSSLNSLSDQIYMSSPDSLIMPPPSTIPSPTKRSSQKGRNLVEQFIDLHLQKQSSFDQDASYSPPSSFSSSSSSFHSQAALSTKTSPICCRKCANNDDQNQFSSDTEDDSQSTTISTKFYPAEELDQQQEQQQQEQQQQQQQQQQQNKRPRSLPIAIQQNKGVQIDDTNDEDEDQNDSDLSLQNSLTCHCSMIPSRKKRFRTSELNHPTIITTATSANGIFSENNLVTTTDKLHIDLKDFNDQKNPETTNVKQSKNSLEHFIMSPTDKVKVQMKYPSSNSDRGGDAISNELKISQPEPIDFKRSRLKAIRVLYQNRWNLTSTQTPVSNQISKNLPTRTATNHCDSPLAKRTSNPRILRSVLSCSVFEADDEHEVVTSTPIATQAGVTGRREKSPIEMFNCLRSNFTESLLHGKILPCGVLDGFTVKLGASGLFMPKQVVLPVTTFWFNVSEHQAASPYLGFINLQCLPKRGYHTPTKGTITLALLNPNGTAVHLFLIIYDLSDMPPDHRTFIRQRVVLMPETTGEGVSDSKMSRSSTKGNLRYLAHIRFVTSQTGKLYMHSDIRLIFARNKLDCDDRTATGKSHLVTLTDVPTPKYWSRK